MSCEIPCGYTGRPLCPDGRSCVTVAEPPTARPSVNDAAVAEGEK